MFSQSKVACSGPTHSPIQCSGFPPFQIPHNRRPGIDEIFWLKHFVSFLVCSVFVLKAEAKVIKVWCEIWKKSQKTREKTDCVKIDCKRTKRDVESAHNSGRAKPRQFWSKNFEFQDCFEIAWTQFPDAKPRKDYTMYKQEHPFLGILKTVYCKYTFHHLLSEVTITYSLQIFMKNPELNSVMCAHPVWLYSHNWGDFFLFGVFSNSNWWEVFRLWQELVQEAERLSQPPVWLPFAREIIRL